jgi:four helix bundle protein
MGMTPEQMRKRTMELALAINAVADPLLTKIAFRETAEQLKDAAESVASNYRATARAKSHRDFTSKLQTACEEADEALGWLIYLGQRGAIAEEALAPVLQEAHEVVAILTAGVKTARSRDQDDARERRNHRRRRRQ